MEGVGCRLNRIGGVVGWVGSRMMCDGIGCFVGMAQVG